MTLVKIAARITDTIERHHLALDVLGIRYPHLLIIELDDAQEKVIPSKAAYRSESAAILLESRRLKRARLEAESH